MFVFHDRVSRYQLLNDILQAYMGIVDYFFLFCYTTGHEHLYSTMEIEIQEMCFVVLGRKKCDFPNFTTLSFTSNVDLSYFYKSNSFDYWIQ